MKNSNLDLVFSNAVKTSLAVARSTWIDKAQTGLKSSRESYIAGISDVYLEDELSGYVELKGKLPIMLELGFSSFDMKDGFSKSLKKKESKEGSWYLTIPFRHYTSGNTNVMPRKILNAAKKLGNNQVLSAAIVRDLGYRPQVSFTGYEWKNSKYDSLKHVVKQYKNSKRGTYITFRRVSENSDKRAFIHPGYKGLNAIDDVARAAEKAFYDAIGD